MHKYLKQFLSFIWNIFVKSIPAHTFGLWFFTDIFKAYAAFINTTIKNYPSYTVLVFIIAFYFFTHLQMKREQKDNRSADQENSDSQSEKKQRSIKWLASLYIKVFTEPHYHKRAKLKRIYWNGIFYQMLQSRTIAKYGFVLLVKW